MSYLRSREELYYGKALELREAVEGWLAYVPVTFPHYTRHTVQHSDEIILQLSKLLFFEEDPSRPALRLSAIEAYILIAASYLHDAGMVTSEKEKADILGSSEWSSWTSGTGGAAKRWTEIEALREGREPADPAIRNFLVDLQVRFLVAEFVRRVHHVRAAPVIAQHHGALGRFAFDDPMLSRTIADICVAHGLRHHELQDDERFPHRRDVRGQQVNVRLMAILLRLGDLLDMSHDRACPLLLNAACPLPADSLAHWTQYQRITHRLTAPDRIDIVAECNDQDEHRVLQDWCQWIVDETKNAAIIMVRATRHGDWRPPNATIDDLEATIRIRPASSAVYIPSKWTFEIDRDAILQRLIFDVHEHERVFIRELVQNALDATRCRMYADLTEEGVETPAYPTQVDEARRSRYPVRLSLRTRAVRNDLSNELEERQALTIEDLGIGMDREIIQRYFLQIGRSYYTTEEFRRCFRFIPTSRFGVGFLSVFAVSDHVTVDTYKPTSPERYGPIRLTVRGPRSYLLTERGERRISGTRIEVLLRDGIQPGQLTQMVRNWCRRVEFPIIVNDQGAETAIGPERPEWFTYEMPDVTKEGARFVVRSFQLNRPGVEGEIYVFMYVDQEGEDWAVWNYGQYRYPETHPKATQPPFPGDLTCLHGIAVEAGYRASGPMSVRVDHRTEAAQPIVGREGIRHARAWRRGLPPEVEERLEEMIKEHLGLASRANSERGWAYKQRLVAFFPLRSFWESLPGTIRLFDEGQVRLVSLRDAAVLPTIVSVIEHWFGRRPELVRRGDRVGAREFEEAALVVKGGPVLTKLDIGDLSDEHRAILFKERRVGRAVEVGSGFLALHWVLQSEEQDILLDHHDEPGGVVELPGEFAVGIPAHKTTHHTYEHVLFNMRHPFVRWLLRVKTPCLKGEYGLGRDQFERLVSLCATSIRYRGHEVQKLARFVDGWRKLGLPEELSPPEIQFDVRMFW